MTVIESARRSAGLSQRRLAQLARTQQSSISEYESRRKSPTLDVVERLLAAAGAELAVKPSVRFGRREDPEAGWFPVPDRLWPVPVPACFSRVHVFYFRAITGYDVWDLSDPEQRSEFYELALCHGVEELLLETVDAALLVEAWPSMNLPDAVRDAWQPLVDAAQGTANGEGPPRDPGGVSARLAAEMDMTWPVPVKARPGSDAGDAGDATGSR
ncbi:MULTISPECIES: helix-turn-helix domain-containing protein [unclassified Nocardioides]|uniref:helix-turn-helix domain-containing protein n=1 Tax=unclassified Nocardioides TaxID=2615069 RepID=UPI00360AB190